MFNQDVSSVGGYSLPLWKHLTEALQRRNALSQLTVLEVSLCGCLANLLWAERKQSIWKMRADYRGGCRAYGIQEAVKSQARQGQG